ncbi:hypothetical protein H7J71_01040 [Mycolicibacterium peregrinum]|uniref:hypothetical protein n=1 Tax=Mycolicibacterium peregrinum TaxID=43304 RepID=UPI0006D7A263|nr:hypothetical protein [Mycolicibacterium peregrinum]MCV7200597.1 hypothetical protein [Mycolicibacterium peregrinum]ORW49786.1 hypothetical protein AWC21_01810 [Mycolicibacterium peregrinum]
MEHQFELAFELLDIAAEQLVNDEYDPTELTNTTYYGLYTIINRHRNSRTGGHVLTVLAYDHDELQAAVEATTNHDHDQPHTRIVKVRAGDQMLHATQQWTFRAHPNHTLTAQVGGEQLWTVQAGEITTEHDDLDAAVSQLLAAA